MAPRSAIAVPGMGIRLAAPLNDGLKEAVNYIISANSTLECSGKLEILCFLFYVEMSVSVDSWG